MQIAGSNVLITGATGGIGQAIARALAARGGKLILTGRRIDVLEPLAQQLDARTAAVDLAEPAELERLRKAIRRVLMRAIEDRGSSISNFVDAEGQPGEYQQRHRAYGREGKLCFRCGAKIRRAIVAGRSSYFCPRCQPPPRLKRTVRNAPKARS